ncbi:hypothetical protein B0A49_06760 [Cryomyces minteri]|uniref:Peptidase A1 domain-containing protein n=1 Tax=Cryomyces minteri TaxID=331657 RepID=A0A4V5NEB8_9PEZI|nr:hypothetical protein B0A49_06760 [Cryomyces minteri]
MSKTYAKYAVEAPTDVKVAAANAAASQQGEVSNTPEAHDQSYLCPVTVGGQTLNLDFDTGSADLWVYSTLMPTSEQRGHSVYNPDSSSSSNAQSDNSWTIQYSDGSGASGTVYADKVVVGSVTATSQAVEAATSVSSAFIKETHNDGLLGLAFSSINTVQPTQQTTFFDTVKSTLAKPLFTAHLKKGAPGSYDFGYIDTSKYTGSITYAHVDTSNGLWEFTASGYAVGSGSTVATPYDSIADTGTSLLYLPTEIVAAYYGEVNGAMYDSSQGGYTVPCDSNLPDFVAIIGGSRHTVPGSYINYAPISETSCFGGIQANDGIGHSVFGDVFLKSQFVVFDGSNSPRVGFAKQA